MKKAGRCIQTLYLKALHNVCEEVRAHFPKVDRLIAEMKKNISEMSKTDRYFK